MRTLRKTLTPPFLYYLDVGDSNLLQNVNILWVSQGYYVSGDCNLLQQIFYSRDRFKLYYVIPLQTLVLLTNKIQYKNFSFKIWKKTSIKDSISYLWYIIYSAFELLQQFWGKIRASQVMGISKEVKRRRNNGLISRSLEQCGTRKSNQAMARCHEFSLACKMCKYAGSAY